MAKLTLKDKYGRVISTTGEDEPVVETGETATIASKPAVRVVATESAETGYVEEENLETWTESTVQIPANFAGLETVMIPTRLRDQLFDIVKVDEQEGYVEITAVHMFYRQRQNHTTWAPGLTTKYSGASACRNVLTNAMFEPGFNVASDSTDQIDGNRLDYENKNIVEAFLDPESGICAKWDLSLIRDNDVFYCLKSVGYDRGFVIQDKKNLVGVERTENAEETITRVAPVARDGDGDLVWMNHNGSKFLDSTHVNDYPAPKLEIYHTDLRIGENGVTADNIQAKLLEAAQKRFSDDKVDIPEVTMTVEFVSLGDTEEYEQYRNLDKVYLYDIVHVKDTERGYSYAAQVVGVQHNILTGVLEAVTIGTPKKWDGVRKIGSWQVPEFNGGNIRPGSIRAGSFESSAVHQGDIAAGAITGSHMSQNADGHFKTIFAEELYISNTSEDGLLNTRFSVSEGNISGIITKTGINSLGQNQTLYSEITQNAESITQLVSKTGINSLGQSETLYGKLTVEAGKISQIVTAVGANGEVTAASIVTAINQTTGQGEVHIDADHVYINAGASGERNVVTEIGGKLVASDITATFLNSKIAEIPTLSGIAANFSGNITSGAALSGYQVYADSRNISNPIMSIALTGPTSGEYTLTATKADGTYNSWTFSSATTLSGAWSGGVFTVTASPQSETILTSLTTGGHWGVAANSEDTKHYYGTISATINSSGTVYDTGKTFEIDASSIYTAGANSVTMSKGSWSSGALTVTASNGNTTTVSLPASSGTTWTNTSGDTWRADLSIGGTTRYSTTKDFSGIRTAGANGVTLSQGSWSNGALTVTASNGKTTTVSVPSVSSTTWENTTGNTWRTKLTIGGATRYSTTKDFSSLLEAQYKAGWNDCVDKITENQWYPTYTTYWNAPSGGTGLSGYWLRSSQYFTVGTIPAKK